MIIATDITTHVPAERLIAFHILAAADQAIVTSACDATCTWARCAFMTEIVYVDGRHAIWKRYRSEAEAVKGHERTVRELRV